MTEVAEAIGKGCNRRLVKAKRFRVATGFLGSYVTTG